MKLTLLPEEILIQIICFTDFTSFPSLSSTSKILAQVSQSDSMETYWKQLVKTYFPYFPETINELPVSTWKEMAKISSSKFLILGNNKKYMQQVVHAFQKVGFCRHVLYQVDKKGIMPDFEYYKQFSSILVIGDGCSFIDKENCAELGDNLMKYVKEKKGGVVIASFSHCSNVIRGSIQGQWKSQNWFPIQMGNQQSLNSPSPIFIQLVHENHFIGKGIAGSMKINTPHSDHSLSGTHPNAKLLATFSDHARTPAVAELVPMLEDGKSGSHRIIGLNFFPYFCNDQENLELLVINCLLYAACPVKREQQ